MMSEKQSGNERKQPLDDEKTQEKHHQEISTQISKKEVRKIHARRRREYSIWHGLGLIGTLGWMVVLPIVLGILAGVWINDNIQTNFPWVLVLLLTGLLIGCVNAWRWIVREQKEIERERKERKGEH